MKHRLIFATFCTLLFAIVGCKKREIITYPPSKGDFVTNSDGLGTARVWGIDFEVAELVGGDSGSEFEGMLHSNPEQTDARIKITFGDDVKIRLEKVPGSPITFQLNGKDYGALKLADKVAIDKERNVTVNGAIRQP